jgi:hypothetical protein
VSDMSNEGVSFCKPTMLWLGAMVSCTWWVHIAELFVGPLASRFRP